MPQARPTLRRAALPLALVLPFGWLGHGSSVGAGTADDCAAERGSELTMGTVFEVTGLDPIVAFGSGVAGQSELNAIYRTALMRFDPATGTYHPHLAESLVSNEDRTVWTLTLRDGVEFGNGDPLTAAAVEFSLERLGETSRFAAGQVQEIESIEVLDDLTLQLTMRRPNGQVPYTLSGEAGMVVNPNVVEALGESFATNPVGAGAGPYEVSRFAPGEELVLTAKDGYWGGPVCIEQLRFVNAGDSRTTWQAFLNDETDVAFLADDPLVVQEARDAGVEAYTDIAAGSSMLNLNNREGRATADVRVRRAIAMAINTETLNDRLFEGTGRAGTTVTDPGQPQWPGVDGISFDPDGARALVDEAKADGWDGTVSMVFSNTPFETDLSITLEAMLEDVGIDVVRENVTPNTALERILQPPYDFELARAQLALLSAGGFARMNQFLSDSVRSRTGYASADMDAAILDLMSAAAIDEERDAYGRIQEIWNRDVPSVPLLTTEWFIAAADDVHGLVFTTEAAILWGDAWIA